MQPGDLARIAPCSACAYFLDADGTLLDMMPRPEDVVADETLRRLLAELAGAARGALALVSGCTRSKTSIVLSRRPNWYCERCTLSPARSELHRLLPGG